MGINKKELYNTIMQECDYGNTFDYKRACEYISNNKSSAFTELPDNVSRMEEKLREWDEKLQNQPGPIYRIVEKTFESHYNSTLRDYEHREKLLKTLQEDANNKEKEVPSGDIPDISPYKENMLKRREETKSHFQKESNKIKAQIQSIRFEKELFKIYSTCLKEIHVNY